MATVKFSKSIKTAIDALEKDMIEIVSTKKLKSVTFADIRIVADKLVKKGWIKTSRQKEAKAREISKSYQ